MLLEFTLVLVAYVIGSFPTALVYSRVVHKVDIRTLGDIHNFVINKIREIERIQ